jgi:ATP-dependent Lon protease
MVESVPEKQVADTLRARALRREANALYAGYSELVDRSAQAVQLRLMASENCGYIADSIAQNSGFDYRDKAKLLCQLHPVRRLEATMKLLQQEIEMLRLETDIQEKTRANKGIWEILSWEGQYENWKQIICDIK